MLPRLHPTVLLLLLLLLPAASASAMPALREGVPTPGSAPAPAPPASPTTPAPGASAPGALVPGASAPAGVIPVPEIAQKAEEVARLIRDFETALLPEPIVGAIEKRLPEVGERLTALSQQTTRDLEAPLAPGRLHELTDQWRTSRDLLTAYVETLAQRIRSIEEALKRLTGLRETWTRTRAEARASRAPAAVIERIDGVLRAVDALHARLETRRTAALVLQDRVARDVALCEATLARLAAARLEAAGRLLQRDSIAVWNTTELAHGIEGLSDRARSALATEVTHLAQFASEQRLEIALQLGLFAILTALMAAARRTESDGNAIFRRPVSAALLLTLLTTWWIHLPAPPRAAVVLLASLALGAALQVMRPLVASGFRRPLRILGALFLIEMLRYLASTVPVLLQQVFVVEMAAAIALVGWHMRRAPQTRPAAARVLLGIFTVALGLGVAGYMRLGLLLGASVIGSAYFALVLAAGVRVVDGLVSHALRRPPLAGLGSVGRHRPLLERRAHGVVRIVGVAVWIVLVLRYFGLWNATVDGGRAALAAELNRGSLSISLGDVLVFVVTLAAAFAISAVIRFVLEEDLYPRFRVGRRLPSVFSTLLHYAIVLVGFLFALAALGVDPTKVTILAGAFGVGIGFGLQSVVNNFVSGLILLVERRIDVGDAVQVGDVAGQVQHMGMRACTVRTWDGAEVIVPNAMLVSERVANWTLSDRLRRIDVAVGVAYGTRPETVIEVLLSVARAHKHVMLEPAPVALFTGFGESALRFELRVWTERFDLWVLTQSELTAAVYEALGAADIRIPFPQREVRLRT